MILGGDEFMRTQRGNNNAYCQDNEISWFHWGNLKKNEEFWEFFRKAIAFEKAHAVLQSRKFFFGNDLDNDHVPEMTWFGQNGSAPSWDDPELRTLSYQLDERGERGDHNACHLFFILNSHPELQYIRLPVLNDGRRWHRVIDTSLNSGEDFLEEGQEIRIDPPDHYLANGRSTVVLIGK